jgi:hypothetical protein
MSPIGLLPPRVTSPTTPLGIHFSVFGDDGEFEGDDTMIGDDPKEPNTDDAIELSNELNEPDADEGDGNDVEE